MGQIVVAAAGAAVGTFFGVPMIGWAVGSALGGAFMGPKAKNNYVNQQGPMLADLRVTGTEYGQVIPYIEGHPRVAGQLWWASDRRQLTHQSTEVSGGATGKGGGGGGGQTITTTTTYTYEVDLLFGLCVNLIGGVSRVWFNGDLVWTDLASASPESLAASANQTLWARMTPYSGYPGQLPDPVYEAAVGTANAPGYRDRGTVLIQSLQLGQSGAIPNITFEVYSAEVYSPPAGLNPFIAVGGTFSPPSWAFAFEDGIWVLNQNISNSQDYTAATSIITSNLQKINGAVSLITTDAPLMTLIALVGVREITAQVTLFGLASLGSADLTTVEYFDQFIDMRNNANLHHYQFSPRLKRVGGGVSFAGCGLDTASTSGILVSLAKLDGTNGTERWPPLHTGLTVDVSGGTNQSLNPAGFAARLKLIARGATVNFN